MSTAAQHLPSASPADRQALDRLRQVAEVGWYLRANGFRHARVRCHGDLARIEVLPDHLILLCFEPLRTELLRRVKALGFTYVTIDLQGYRAGCTPGASEINCTPGNAARASQPTATVLDID
jgi:uncharacterized protein